MKRRPLKPCCPTCGRAIPQPKPTRERMLLARLYREAFVALAFAAPEWHAVGDTWGPPRRGRGLDMQPAMMTTGTTTAPDVGAWEQAELVTYDPNRREAWERDCDLHPCALHRARAA